jgi:hypothetical protein
MATAKQRRNPNADLLMAVREHKDQIQKVRDQVEHEKPLLLLDFQRMKIHTYPYDEYKSRLRERTQTALDQEYNRAAAKNKVFVLVWDSQTRRLVTTAFRRA